VNNTDPVLGYLLIAAIGGWAVWYSIKQLRETLGSGTAVDRTLSEVDNPRLFHMQVIGFALLAVLSGVIAIAAIVAAVQAIILQWK
jgi:hypothetical protein